MSFQGSIESFSLAEVFQSLAVSHHTGTLRITSGPRHHEVYLSDGEIAFVSNAAASGFRIGEILVRQGKVRPEDVREALAEKARNGGRIGDILVKLGRITPEDVEKALRLRVEEELYDLFLLEGGEFRFDKDVAPEGLDDPRLRTCRLKIPPTRLIVEGIRRLDEWNRIRGEFPPLSEILERTGDAPPDDADAKIVLGRIDGRTPIEAIFARVPFGRFECGMALHRLLSCGAVRPLARDALLRWAEEAPALDAITFLRCAFDRDPADVAIASTLADALAAEERGAEAVAILERAVDAANARKDAAAVACLHEQILRHQPTHLGTLESLVRRQREAGDTAAAAQAAARYAEALRRAGRDADAAASLEEAVDLGPETVAYRIEAARAWKAAGRIDIGIAHMEAVAERLEAARSFCELVKTLRWILDADPSRADIKHRINQLVILQERTERQSRRRRLALAAAGGIAAIAVGICALYEIRARHIYGRARACETFEVPAAGRDEARALYQRIVSEYGWSTVAGKASSAIERLVREDAEASSARGREVEEGILREQERLESLRRTFDALCRSAQEAEDRGEYASAARICTEVAQRYEALPAARSVTAPVAIRTEPAGAEVVLEGRGVGRTPIVVRRAPSSTIEVTIRLKGHVARRIQIGPHDPALVSVSLDREVRTVARLPGPAGSIRAGEEGRVLVSARDGFVHAIVPPGATPVWSTKIGEFADPPAAITLRGEMLFVGSVDGVIRSIDTRTGEVRWSIGVPGPSLGAPAVSADGRRIAVSDAQGVVHLIGDGADKARFAGEAPFVADIAFGGPGVLAAGADGFFHGLKADTLEPEYRTELPGEAVAGIALADPNAIVGCRDGSVVAIESAGGKILWVRKIGDAPVVDLLVAADVIVSWCTDGRIVALHLEGGEEAWRIDTGARGAGSLAAVDGVGIAAHRAGPSLFAFDPRQGSVLWRSRPQTAAAGAPAIAGRTVYVGVVDGGISAVENQR